MQAGIINNSETRSKKGVADSRYLLLIYPKPIKGAAVLSQPGPIELASFEAEEIMEATIIRWMHRVLSGQPQFNLYIQQWHDAALGSKQLRIGEKTALQTMAKELRVISQFLSSYGYKEIDFKLKVHTAMTMVIADPAYHLQLASAGDDYAGDFQVQSVVLMKRSNNSIAFKQANVFGLYPRS